jgi:hypothetical protein
MDPKLKEIVDRLIVDLKITLAESRSYKLQEYQHRTFDALKECVEYLEIELDSGVKLDVRLTRKVYK